MSEYLTKLSTYLPAGTAPIIIDWITRTGCQFRIAKSRRTKFGDYRPPFRDQGHRISVNYDLNPYAFLITTIHEFAHLKTWIEHKNLVRPHGKAWKQNFMILMKPFLGGDIFPEDIKQAVRTYLENPAASTCTDLNLFRVLRRYDEKKEDNSVTTVENVPAGDHFILHNGRVFRKLQKIRRRFRCVELATQRIYLFSPLAEVSLCRKDT